MALDAQENGKAINLYNRSEVEASMKQRSLEPNVSRETNVDGPDVQVGQSLSDQELLAKLQDAEINAGVSGPDVHVGKMMIWKWALNMVEIDFNRMMESAKDELQLTKALFMPLEQKRQEYISKERRDRTEKRFYEQGGRHDSNRQLYMLKLVTTPLIEMV